MRNKGFTLLELMVAMTVLGFLIVGTMSVFSESMKGFYRSKTDINITADNSLGMQRVAGTIRTAYSMTILSNGTVVSYYLPKQSAVNDAVTGEKEYVEPMVPEAAPRSFTVTNGQLKDDSSGRVLAKNITLTDPDPKSSQYNKTYAPFQLTTIGSRNALSINFITQENVLGKPRYTRMKTTVVLRNNL